MKKIALSFHYITLFIFCQVLALLANFNPVFASSTNNFSFDKFVGDYYVTRDKNGDAHMHVHEILVAKFPDYNQNHGITRSIPFFTGDGAVKTIPSKSALNISVKRNGEEEPIDHIDSEDQQYTIYIGSASTYVTGTQIYELEYDFENVILGYDKKGQLSFDDNLIKRQELYWDTNGTGWAQRFDSLTANVHFEEDVLEELLGEEPSCYVGKYLTSGNSSRCEITKTADGYSFETEDLYAGENLTFDIAFKAGTFRTPEASYNYALVIITAAVALIALVVIVKSMKTYSSYDEKRSFYKNSPVPPQYIPIKDLSVAEADIIGVKTKPDSKVATLISLAVRHKIELVKGDKKIFGGYKWKIAVKNLSEVARNEEIVLEILNHGKKPAEGDTIEVKSQSYSTSVALLAKSYTRNAEESLAGKGYREEKATSKNDIASSVGRVLTTFFLIWGLSICLPIVITAIDISGGILVGGAFLPFVIGALIITIIVIRIVISHENDLYKNRTMKGLEAAVYLKGLRLYMEMAEKERLEFLQSVKGADTSTEGIVKLYEKLLPYAIIFGIENSWLEELNQYYETEGVESPTWYSGTGPIIISDFRGLSSSVSSSISSGSTNSSSSSGGGGGGFSGGGGGGGGGGGW